MKAVPSILLVDDNDDDVLLIREAFATQTQVQIIDAVPDGEAALAYLQYRKNKRHEALPDLLLLDINMPKMNGFEVLQAIKGDPQLQHIPVIILTTSDRNEDIIRAYSNGACSYVHKPITLQDMIAIATHFASYWFNVVSIPSLSRG